MNRTTIGILLIGVAVATFAWLAFFRKRKGASCVAIVPGKFPAWIDSNIPHGTVREIADEFVTPVLGGDPHTNGSIVGGFFKAIDTYPSKAAAAFYESELLEFFQTRNALPYWRMKVGERLC